MKSLSYVQLFVTPWTAAYQAPPSMGFSRQEYWSGVPLPSPTPALTTPNAAIPAVACCAPSAWDTTPTWPSPTITESTVQILLLFYHFLHPKWRQTYLFPVSQVLHRFGGFPGAASGKEPACQWGRHKRWGFNPWAGKIPWRRAWQPTLVFLPGETHGQRSLCP